MKKVECDKCKHFIPLIQKDENNILSGIKTNAKCKLGKRVLFRLYEKKNPNYTYGEYTRFCNEFNK